MSANVSTFVISVDGQVEAHQLNEVAVISKAKLVSQVVAVVLVLLNWNNLAILVNVAVDFCGDGRELGNQIHGILKSVLPVLRLVHALSICLGERRLVLESSDRKGELSHWMEVIGAAVD